MLFIPIGTWELVLLFFVVLLFFGGKRLPGLAKSIGSGIYEFRKGLSGKVDHEEDESPEKSKKYSAKGKDNS